ncbi:Outer membrane protein assembly factor BamD [Candidatus Ecksteinia adelgidicola]|nr:Outer membrane protein assembly factor BamD [Candidatus Ecksteinia adelgidicola]
MIFIKWLPVSIILILSLIGCSFSQNLIFEKPSLNIYNTIKKKLKNGHFRNAIIQLKALQNNQYIFEPYSQQIQLYLIYAYYKSGHFLLAKTSIDQFIRLYPTHQNIDYVMYMRGLIDMKLDSNIFYRIFNIDCSDRDPQYANSAFYDFIKLINQFPKSKYSANSKKKLMYLKERLAQYELSVAKYYLKHDAYVAVINRIEEMLKKYPDTKATRHALPLMEHAYRQLQLNSQAEKVAKIIAVNNL